MEKIRKYILPSVCGLCIGVINGLFGSGGGMIAVPTLKKLEFDQKEAQANAIAVILPITVVSAIMYLYRGNVTFGEAFIYVPGGIIGSLIGTFLMRKISSVWLKRIFGAFMIWAGVRLLFK